jgi:hypothetical protein
MHHLGPAKYLAAHGLTAGPVPWIGDRPKPAGILTAAEQAARLDELRATVAHASAAKSAQARQRHDGRTRRLGYTGLDDLLQATQPLPQRAVAPMLGVSASSVGRLRANISPRSPGGDFAGRQRTDRRPSRDACSV